MPGTPGPHRSAASSSSLVIDPPLTPGAGGRAAAKQAMRARIRAERRLRSPGQQQRDAVALAQVLLELPQVAGSGCVAAYASTGGEPGTHHLLAGLRRLGVRVLLPVTLGDGTLDWAEADGDLRPGRGPGGPEPAGPRLGPEGVRQAGVVLAPALAVDTLRHRLGQGGGYYDRALALVDRAVPVLALVHDGELLDAAVEPVPVEPHDRPVDAAVTPRRCLWLTPPQH